MENKDKHILKTFWLSLTYQCNSGCHFCYASQTGFKGTQMPLEYAKSICDEMSRIGVERCILIGGEPTLYTQLQPLIRHLSALKIHTSIVTNGFCLQNKGLLTKLKNSGLDNISLSIHASNKLLHKNIMNKDTFEDVIKSIKNGISLGSSFISTNTTIQKQNADDCINILYLLEDLGVQSIMFTPCAPSIGKDGVFTDNLLSFDEYKRIIENIYNETSKVKARITINSTVPLCYYGNSLENMLKTGFLKSGCMIYRGTGVIFECEGNVLPCNHLYDYPILRNVSLENKKFKYSGNFDKIWFGKNTESVKFREKFSTYPSKKCSNCSLWGKCIGGCPIFWTAYKAEDYIVSLN